MPHSEYPSGSACICLMLKDFIDSFLKERFGDDSISIVFSFPKGSSKIEPGVTPKNDLLITMNNLTEFYQTCGSSRLWSGVHFTPSVTASYNLCHNLGVTGFEFVKTLIPGGLSSIQ